MLHNDMFWKKLIFSLMVSRYKYLIHKVFLSIDKEKVNYFQFRNPLGMVYLASACTLYLFSPTFGSGVHLVYRDANL